MKMIKQANEAKPSQEAEVLVVDNSTCNECRVERLRGWVQEQVGELPATNMLEIIRRCSGDEEVVMESGH